MSECLSTFSMFIHVYLSSLNSSTFSSLNFSNFIAEIAMHQAHLIFTFFNIRIHVATFRTPAFRFLLSSVCIKVVPELSVTFSFLARLELAQRIFGECRRSNTGLSYFLMFRAKNNLRVIQVWKPLKRV